MSRLPVLVLRCRLVVGAAGRAALGGRALCGGLLGGGPLGGSSFGRVALGGAALGTLGCVPCGIAHVFLQVAVVGARLAGGLVDAAFGFEAAIANDLAGDFLDSAF